MRGPYDLIFRLQLINQVVHGQVVNDGRRSNRAGGRERHFRKTDLDVVLSNGFRRMDGKVVGSVNNGLDDVGLCRFQEV